MRWRAAVMASSVVSACVDGGTGAGDTAVIGAVTPLVSAGPHDLIDPVGDVDEGWLDLVRCTAAVRSTEVAVRMQKREELPSVVTLDLVDAPAAVSTSGPPRRSSGTPRRSCSSTTGACRWRTSGAPSQCRDWGA